MELVVSRIIGVWRAELPRCIGGEASHNTRTFWGPRTKVGSRIGSAIRGRIHIGPNIVDVVRYGVPMAGHLVHRQGNEVSTTCGSRCV